MRGRIWTTTKIDLTFKMLNISTHGKLDGQSMFFARFNFHITYRPGTKNVKLDALSKQFSMTDQPKTETHILPYSCFMGALTWAIDNDIKEAQKTKPDPGNGPRGKIFILSSVKSKVLDWIHGLYFTCHLGTNRVIYFSERYFWWPSMYKDIK